MRKGEKSGAREINPHQIQLRKKGRQCSFKVKTRMKVSGTKKRWEKYAKI